MSNEVNDGGRGFNIVVLDSNKNLIKTARYDTYERGNYNSIQFKVR